MNCDRVITIDIHKEAVLDYFDCPHMDLKAAKVIADYFKDKKIDLVLSPDIGAAGRARDVGERMGVPYDHLDNSFKTHQDIVRNPLAIRFSAGVANYVKAWHDGKFGRAILNSVIYTGCTVVIVLLFATLAAYVIAGRKIRGTSAIMSFFMVTMTMPVYLFLVPLYRVYAQMNWLGRCPG